MKTLQSLSLSSYIFKLTWKSDMMGSSYLSVRGSGMKSSPTLKWEEVFRTCTLKVDILAFHDIDGWAAAPSNNTYNLDPALCWLESSFLHTYGRKITGSNRGLGEERGELLPLPKEQSIFIHSLADLLLSTVRLPPRIHYSWKSSLQEPMPRGPRGGSVG